MGNLSGMLLSARMLNDVGSVNSFEYAQIAQMTTGDQVDIYFQLIDASKNAPVANNFWSPSGLRYVPEAPCTLQVVLKSVDDAKTVTRFASQPWPTQDPSIWRLSMLPTDTLAGTFGLQLLLTEVGRQTRGYVAQAVQIHGQNPTFC